MDKIMYRLDAYIIGIFSKNFSCLSLIGAEKITFPPLCLRRTDILNYRVASLLKNDYNCKLKGTFKTSTCSRSWSFTCARNKIHGNFLLFLFILIECDFSPSDCIRDAQKGWLTPYITLHPFDKRIHLLQGVSS